LSQRDCVHVLSPPAATPLKRINCATE
jgi:hypothetical protein